MDDDDEEMKESPAPRLVGLVELEGSRLEDYQVGDRILIGREEFFEYEKQQGSSLVEEWDGLIHLEGSGLAVVSFESTAPHGPPGIGWTEYVRLLRASVSERHERLRDIELVEPDDLYQDGIGYRIAVRGAVTLKDVYDRTQAVEREIMGPVRQAQRLVAEFVEATERSLLGDRASLPALLAAVRDTRDGNAKGVALEQLIAELFQTVPDMQVASTRALTETEEIDIVVYNHRTDAPWRDEGFYILVECKNWSTACGKDELVVFQNKMRNRRQRAKCGVFVSWNGFTGTSRAELLRTSEGPNAILLLTAEDVERAVAEGDFLSILAERLDEAILS